MYALFVGADELCIGAFDGKCAFALVDGNSSCRLIDDGSCLMACVVVVGEVVDGYVGQVAVAVEIKCGTVGAFSFRIAVGRIDNSVLVFGI